MNLHNLAFWGGTRRRLMMMTGMEDEEMLQWKELDEVILNDDAKIIEVSIPNASEIIAIFFGRENNSDDTLNTTSGASDGLSINQIRVSTYPLTYIRINGFSFHTIVRAKCVRGFIDGTISKKGNSEMVGFSGIIENAESIKSITFATNNLFKSGSKLKVLYR